MYCSVLPSISPCFNIITTTTVREHRQRAVIKFWGPSGVLQPLADASESANQCDLGIEIECGITHLIGYFTVLLWSHALDQKFYFFKDYVPYFVLDRLVDVHVYH